MKKFNLAAYIIPSVISMVLVGTYTNVDGLFIGNRAGDAGLTAINIAWPIVAFVTSAGTGLGVGAAVVINGLRGEGEYPLAEKVKRIAFVVLAVSGLVVTAICSAIYSPFLVLLGAEGEVLGYAKDYSLIISLGAVFQVLGAGLVVLLRNEGKNCSALAYTAVGLLAHIGLDFLLVGKYELYGVAAATVASQALVAGLSAITFARGRGKNKTDGKSDERGIDCAKKILKHSFAPFGLNFVPSASLMFTNFFTLKVGGVAAVGAYTVMSYLLYTYDYVYQGVCDGVQPALSYYRGSGDAEEERKTVYKAIVILVILSAVFMAATPAAIAFLPEIFSVSAEATEMLRIGFIVYAFAYPLKAAVKFICAYEYSVGKIGVSNLITYLDPFLFTPASLAVASLSGTTGIWIALPVSQALTILAALVILSVEKLRKKK